MADDAIVGIAPTDDAVILGEHDELIDLSIDAVEDDAVEAPKDRQAAIQSIKDGVEAQETPLDALGSTEKPDLSKGTPIPGDEGDKPAEPIIEAPKPIDESVKDAKDVEDAPEAGKFRVKDKNGQFAETPDVKVEFRVGDKVYNKDTAGLVRMAQDAITMQKFPVRVAQLEAEIPSLKQSYEAAIQDLEAVIERQETLLTQTFSDDSGETWAKNQARFAELMSPEAQLQRERAARAASEAQAQQTQESQYRTNYRSQRIDPVVIALDAESPDVPSDAKTGRLWALTNDLIVNGQIPLQNFAEVERRVKGPYAEYVRAEQAKATASRKAVEASIAAEREKLEKERRVLQKQQNASVREVAPKGSAPKSSAPVAMPAPRSRAEARAQILAGGND